MYIPQAVLFVILNTRFSLHDVICNRHSLAYVFASEPHTGLYPSFLSQTGHAHSAVLSAFAMHLLKNSQTVFSHGSTNKMKDK